MSVSLPPRKSQFLVSSLAAASRLLAADYWQAETGVILRASVDGLHKVPV